MSRFNLASFIDLLLSALDGKKSKDAMSESSVYLDLTRRVYNFVAKTLSKDARLAFALYLVRSSPESAWTTPEWDVFTRRVHFRLKESSSIPPWVDKSCRSSFSSLHEYCPNIVNAAQFDDIKMWKSWFSHHRCEERFPREVKLTAIERLMVLQAFRPDRIISAVEEYCKCELGVEGLDPEVERLDNMFGSVKEINAPVLLIARNGADPCPELESLAEKIVGRDR
jgi:dynein heavy chain 2